MSQMPSINSDKQLLVDLEDYVAATQPEFELIGGEADILQIASNLSRSSANNIIFVGPSGVGKTSVLYGIAAKLKAATDDPEIATEVGLPLEMVGKTFLRLDVDGLFDTNEPRKIQEDIKRIFAELERPGEPILIIEDINDFLRALDNNQCHGMLSSFMRKLRYREFQTVWMVRDDMSKNRLEEVMDCHSEIRELFTVIEKKEPQEQEVIKILTGRKTQLEGHYEGLNISEGAILEVIKLTHAYPNLKMWTRHQPARGINLLDRMASKFVSRAQTRPPELTDLEASLAKEEGATERESLLTRIETVREDWKSKARLLYQYQGQFRKWQKKFAELENRLHAAQDSLRHALEEERKDAGHATEITAYDLDQHKTSEIRDLEVDLRTAGNNLEKVAEASRKLKCTVNNSFVLLKENVDSIFGELSQIPVSDLNEDETERILHLNERIKQSVYGQDECVDIIANTIKSAKAGLKSPKRPMGIFICLGSSGVGKSYLAEVVAQELFNDSDSITPFDMSEFMEKHTVSQLKGAPPGYAGYGDGGRLTNAVREKPYQAILLDEVEKAHPDVFKILLQVFNDGRLSDENGTARFNNTVFFLTTNLAQELAMSGEVDAHSAEGREAIICELKRHFPQELLNRVDEFLLFNPLKPEHIKKVIQRDLKELNQKESLRLKGITVNLSDSDVDRIVAGKYRVEEGARQVQKFIENRMSAGLVPILLENQNVGGGVIEVHYAPESKDSFEYHFTRAVGDSSAEDVDSQGANAALAPA